ncbi:hypothetical protein [Rhizobium sp. BK060]|uniref:hypothetical protein n=1 Tax=Rhizobium sp. BK060 TaxID=2587096 RepID=UPI00160DD1E1|nr:hypothetical protein [Rhizobium sp. BK060]
MLPLVDILSDLLTHAERAEWLTRVPDGVVFRDHMDIRKVLQAAGFGAGVAYLDARLAAVNSVRLPDGALPQTRIFALNLTQIDLNIAARAGATGAE